MFSPGTLKDIIGLIQPPNKVSSANQKRGPHPGYCPSLLGMCRSRKQAQVQDISPSNTRS